MLTMLVSKYIDNMGRLYTGDIEGKFWVAVQNSDDPSFFGGEMSEPNYVEYYFEKDDLPKIKEGVEKCLAELGDNKVKMDKFFKENVTYNDEMLDKVLEIGEEKVKIALVWYARLELGKKILKQVEKKGYCGFTAEL